MSDENTMKGQALPCRLRALLEEFRSAAYGYAADRLSEVVQEWAGDPETPEWALRLGLEDLARRWPGHAGCVLVETASGALLSLIADAVAADRLEIEKAHSVIRRLLDRGQKPSGNLRNGVRVMLKRLVRIPENVDRMNDEEMLQFLEDFLFPVQAAPKLKVHAEACLGWEWDPQWSRWIGRDLSDPGTALFFADQLVDEKGWELTGAFIPDAEEGRQFKSQEEAYSAAGVYFQDWLQRVGARRLGLCSPANSPEGEG